MRAAAIVCGLAMLAACGKKASSASRCEDAVVIEVGYPGASPAEVEQSVLLALEAVAAAAGAREVHAVAENGHARLALVPRGSADELARELRDHLDRAATLPEDAEVPMVYVARAASLRVVAVRGELDAAALRAVALRVRDRLLAEPGVRRVMLLDDRGPELRIEVDSARLAAMGVTLDELVAAVGRSAADLPGGAIDARGDELLIRTAGHAGPDLDEIVIAVRAGIPVRLRDAARLRETTVTSAPTTVDGLPAWLLAVDAEGAIGRPPIDELPPGVSLALLGELAPRCGPVEMLVGEGALGQAAAEFVARKSSTRASTSIRRVRLTHPDLEQLAAATAALRVRLGAAWTSTSTASAPELSMRLAERARSLGITAAQVAAVVRTATGGVEVARYQRRGEELRVVVALGDGEASREQLFALPIASPTGEIVPLSAVADFEETLQPVRIERRDGRRVAYLTGVDQPDPAAIVRAARAELMAAHPDLEIEIEP